MLGIADSPSRRIVYRGHLCLAAVVVTLLGALVLAASAHASGPEASGIALPAEPVAGEPVAGEGAPKPPLAEEGTRTPSPPSPESLPNPEGAANAPSTPRPAEEQPKAASPPPPAPPSAPAPPPTSEPIPAPAELPNIPIVSVGSEEAPKSTSTDVSNPEAPKAVLDTPVPAVAGTAHNGPGSEIAAEAPPEDASGVPSAVITGPTTVGATAATQQATHESTAPRGLSAGIGALGGGGLGCALSLGERTMHGCAGASSGSQRLLSISPMGLGGGGGSLDAATDPPPDGGHGGSAVGGPPAGPAPASAPSGASGAAAGGGGLALSGFLTLAGLLLLGAPRAMRRLRLSCRPWLTACFVLIPERPG